MATIYRNRQLMYLSVILFFYFACIGCLSPFLTSHMRHLGFTLSEISFINAVSAFISLIGPVLFGTLAEKKNRYKSTTAFCILLGAVAFAALSFVPRYQKLHYHPLMDFDCNSGLRIERCINWGTCSEALEPNENFTKVKLRDCEYRCPSSHQFTKNYPLHICFHGDSGNICVVYDVSNRNDSLTDFESHLHSWPYVEVAAVNLPEKNATALEEDTPRAHVAMCNYRPSGLITFGQKTYHSISCRPSSEACSIHCKVEFTSGGNAISPRQCEEAYGNPTTTFWSYLVLRSIGDLCLLSTICLLDAITIWSTIDYEGAYGRIHVWAALGIAAMAPFSGALMDHFSHMDGRIDFSPSAFLSASFALVTCALVIALPIHRQKSSQFQQAMTPAKNAKFLSCEMIVFLLILLILGMQWSILFTFLPWITMDIGCSGVLIGLSLTLMFGFALPFLLISKNMVRNIGRANLLVFALLFYFTRYAGVTFVTTPWWTLPFALMGSFTLCVMWIAAVAYGQALAPSGCNLIMQYVLNVVHFGIGRGIGSLVGGSLINIYNQRIVFCGIAVFSVVTAFLYLLIYHGALKKKKPAYPGLINGSWYPMRERFPNGYAKAHQPIVVDQDDDVDTTPNSHQINKK